MAKKIIVAVLVAAAVILGAWYLMSRKAPQSAGVPGEELSNEGAPEGAAPSAQTLGGTLYEGSAVANPVQKLPETNPFTTDVNPFKGAYTNPFE